jgi:hypothetical protein
MAYSDKKYTWAPLIILAINLLIEINMFQFFLQGVYHG